MTLLLLLSGSGTQTFTYDAAIAAESPKRLQIDGLIASEVLTRLQKDAAVSGESLLSEPALGSLAGELSFRLRFDKLISGEEMAGVSSVPRLGAEAFSSVLKDGSSSGEMINHLLSNARPGGEIIGTSNFRLDSMAASELLSSISALMLSAELTSNFRSEVALSSELTFVMVTADARVVAEVVRTITSDAIADSEINPSFARDLGLTSEINFIISPVDWNIAGEVFRLITWDANTAGELMSRLRQDATVPGEIIQLLHLVIGEGLVSAELVMGVLAEQDVGGEFLHLKITLTRAAAVNFPIYLAVASDLPVNE